MGVGVHDFREIPLLFVSEGEKKMGATRKTTPEVKDKIIQFLWDYQDKHNGDTPAQVVIGRHSGINPSGIGYWLGLLIDDGRLNKISSNPFRATITDHPKNKSAIERFKRLRQRIEDANEREREQIRQRQAEDAQTEQLQQDRAAVFAAAPTVEALPAPVAGNNGAPVVAAPEVQAIDRLARTRGDYLHAQKAVKSEMPKLLKIADERDLVFELISRGYTITKVR
jgi:hypothetical protein